MHAFQIGAFQSDAFQIPLEEATAPTGGGGGGLGYIEYRVRDKDGREYTRKMLRELLDEALTPPVEQPSPEPEKPAPKPTQKPPKPAKRSTTTALDFRTLEALQAAAAQAQAFDLSELAALQARLRAEKQEAAEALALQIATERLEAIVAAEAFERKKRAAAIALITILAAV